MRKLCEMAFSDGSECLEIAVANIGKCWYCAEHYDIWMKWYRKRFEEYGDESCGRVLKENQ